MKANISSGEVKERKLVTHNRKKMPNPSYVRVQIPNTFQMKFQVVFKFVFSKNLFEVLYQLARLNQKH
jgi:hypothetical protein